MRHEANRPTGPPHDPFPGSLPPRYPRSFDWSKPVELHNPVLRAWQWCRRRHISLAEVVVAVAIVGAWRWLG